MSRRMSLLLLPGVAVLVLAALRTAPAPVPAAPELSRAKTVTVTVVFKCDGLRAVDPWQVRAAEGDTIVWVLDTLRSDVTEFSIDRKRALGRFPFQTRPLRGGRGRPAAGRDMKPNASGTYQYNIVSQCPGPGNAMQRAVIDPDIIIDVQ